MQNTTEKNTNATLKTGNGLLAMSESAALRGIAILGIMLHNYCHWLGFAVKENEYTFDAELLLRTLWCARFPLRQRLRTCEEIRERVERRASSVK